MPELIIGCVSAPSGIADAADQATRTHWQPGTVINANIKADITNADTVDSATTLHYARNEIINSALSVVYDNNLVKLATVSALKNLGIHPRDSRLAIHTPNDLQSIDTSNLQPYSNTLPTKDILSNKAYHGVHLLSEKAPPPGDYKYLPNSNFAIDNVLMGFTSDFVDPLDYDKLKTPLSPLGFSTGLPWARTKTADIRKSLTYGYGINKFIVGGSTHTLYPVDEDALDLPPTPDIPIQVIKIVNNVSVVVLPGRAPVSFNSIKLNRHIDSFAWQCQINLLDQTSYDALKPSVSGYVEIEVAINGTLWQLFVAKGSHGKSFGERSYLVTGFSLAGQLQAPYSAKQNYTNPSNVSISQLASDVLAGTGFTAQWDVTPNWTVNANSFSYQNKTPIEALSAIAQSVGAVIHPDLINKTLHVAPWANTSPWAWSGLTSLPELTESLCYQVSEDYAPQQQADAIYVAGGESGVLVKCTINGTAGNNLLQTVTDNLLSDTAAATERGRIELAKSGLKQDIPITSYIDENESLLMPGDMVKIAALEQADWQGMVTNIEISVQNQATEVYQQLTVLRHYE